MKSRNQEYMNSRIQKGDIMDQEEKRDLIEKLSVEVATVCHEYHGFNQTMSMMMKEILQDLRKLRDEVGLSEKGED